MDHGGGGIVTRGETGLSGLLDASAYWAISLVAVFLVPVIASAHHGRGEFFHGTVHEIEGEVVEVLWRNPHVMIVVRAPTADGSEAIWYLEGSDSGTLARRGLPAGLVQVGDHIKAAGRTSNRREHWLATSHVLLPSGTEMVFGRGAPRWASEYIGGDRGPGAAAAATATAAPEGIFRVWIRDLGTPYDVSEAPPLTPAARAAFESYDPLHDDPVLDCVIPGMPRVMTVVGSRPIEFEQRGEDILLHSENYNQTRVIHMNGERDPGSVPVTPLGYSRGRWDGNTLIVTTTRVSWSYFDLPPLIGIPQSEDVEIVERFTLNDSEDELVYDFWANDPVNFTAPIAQEGFMVWSWQPGETLRTDACENYVDVPEGV